MGLHQRIGQLLQGDVRLGTDDLGQKPDMRRKFACRARNAALRHWGKVSGLVLAVDQPDDRTCTNPKNPPSCTPGMPRRTIARDPNPKIK